MPWQCHARQEAPIHWCNTACVYDIGIAVISIQSFKLVLQLQWKHFH